MSLTILQKQQMQVKVAPKNQELVKNGMSASPYFNRKNYASIMDSKLAEKHIQEKADALGEGSYRLQMVDKAGNVKKGQILNLGGKMHTSNSAGIYNIVDVDYLKQKEAIAKEEQAYINTVVYLASSSIESLATTLGLDVLETVALCKRGGIAASGLDPEGYVPDAVDDMNCHPEVLKLLDDNSLQMAMAVSKIRALIRFYSPILDQDTGTNAAVRDETK